MENAPSKHARFGPSSMARIMACPGSVKLSEQAPPEKPSPYAAEGTQAHEVAEALLLLEDPPDCPAEMREAVQVYVDFCDPLIERARHYGIEDTVRLDEELFGTVDCWALVERTLHVIDYKHGAGVRVPADGNRQLMTYAGLVLEDEDVPVTWSDIDAIMMTIVQPRAYDGGTDSYATDTSIVMTHMQEVDRAINSAKHDSAPIVMGDHCRWCRAKLICPAIDAAEQGIAHWDSRDLAPEQIAEMLVDAKVIEAKIKELYAYAEQQLEDGYQIPDWKLVARRAQRKWKSVGEVEIWARKHRLFRKLQNQALMSPAQAAKVLTDSQFQQLETFIEKKSSGTTLAPESDPRPAVEPVGAAMTALGKRLV